jgi:hypothetical protein
MCDSYQLWQRMGRVTEVLAAGSNAVGLWDKQQANCIIYRLYGRMKEVIDCKRFYSCYLQENARRAVDKLAR